MSQAQVIGYNPNAGALQQRVLIHEAMHTLGAGHGCAWTSTQSYCGLAPADTLPSFEDAAYLLLAMEVKAAAWKHRALHGLTRRCSGKGRSSWGGSRAGAVDDAGLWHGDAGGPSDG